MPIVSRYEQSKLDTQSVSTWLARTAIAYGYPLEQFRRSANLTSSAGLEEDDDNDDGFDGEQAGEQQRKTKLQIKNAKRNAKKKAKARAKREEEAGSGKVAGGNDNDSDDDDEGQGKTAADDAALSNNGGGSSSSTPLEPAPALPTGQYTITAGEYVKLAQFLADKKVDIPLELLQLIRRCIGLRLASLRRFLQAPDLSTVTHKFFIEKLREAGSILHEARERRLDERVQKAKKAAAAKGKGDASKPPAEPSKNRFESLEELVQEGEDLPEELEDIKLSAPPRPSNRAAPAQDAKARFDLQLSVEEAVIDVALFFNDMQDVRDQVKELWESYRDGKCDLITAAVCTNTALELLRQSHDTLLAHVPPDLRDNTQGLLMALMLKVGGRRMMPQLHFVNGQMAVDSPALWTPDQIDEDDEELQRMHDFFMVPVYLYLEALGRVLQPGCVPIYRPGHFGNFDTSVDSFKLPFKKRWQQAKVLILETLADYLFVVLGQPATGGQREALFRGDEIARLMYEVVVEKKPSLLGVLAAQIFIDMNFILRADSKRGHEELQRQAKRMQDSLDARLTVEPRPAPSSWFPQNDRMARMLHAELGQFSGLIDPINKVRDTYKPMLPPDERDTKSMLFDRNPCLCGVTLFRMLLAYQDFGIALCNAWGTVLYSTQLWEAASKWGVIRGRNDEDDDNGGGSGGGEGEGGSSSERPQWRDMQLILKMHDEEEIWGGKVPASIDDAQISFMASTGHSTHVMQAVRAYGVQGASPRAVREAQRRGANIPLESARGPKTLQERSCLMPIFRKKFRPDATTGAYLDIEGVERAIIEMQAEQEVKERKAVGSASGSGSSAGGGGGRAQRSHKLVKYSVLQLLSVLEKALEQEMLYIRFDYVSMHLRCIEMLRAVHRASDPYLSRKLGPNYMENESQLPFLVGNIFNVSTFSGRAAEATGLMREMRHTLGRKGMEGVQVGSRLLVSVADTIRDFLRTTGEADAEAKKIGRAAL